MNRFPKLAAYLTGITRDWFHSCDDLHRTLRSMAERQQAANLAFSQNYSGEETG